MGIRLFGASKLGRLSKAALPKSKYAFHSSSLLLHHQQHEEPTYYMPHESVPHTATILGFPSRQSVSKALHAGTCREIVDLAATIAEFEPVRLYTRPEDIASAQELVKQRIRELHTGESKKTQDDAQNQNTASSDLLASHISILPCITNHCWVRDTGPVFVRPSTTSTSSSSTRFAIDFSFCEWGNKHLTYTEHSPPNADDEHTWPVPTPAIFAENMGFASRVIDSFSSSSSSSPSSPGPVTRIPSRVRLEGGGIEVDGQGTFLATESSILCGERNPGLTRTDAEQELSRLLGVRKFIWFPGRRGLDVTDAHVDAEVRVVRPGVVVISRPYGYSPSPSTAAPGDSGDDGTATPAQTRIRKEWTRVYEEIRSILARSTDACGRPFEVHEIEEPDPRYVVEAADEEDPAASYVNFYFANGAVVVPAFGDPSADERAVQTMQRLLPDRTVRTVRVNCLPRMGGVLHCVTQQVPL